MNKENTEKLLNDFPYLYKNLRYSHFECGDGWYELLYNMSKQIDFFIKDIKLKEEDLPSIMIVKEKFGTLNLQGYTAGEAIYEDVYRIIKNTENQSLNICEICGHSPAKRHAEGWIKTMCTVCIKNEEK